MHAFACTLYQELAVTIAHKIVTSLATEYCIVSTCDEDNIHSSAPLAAFQGSENHTHSFLGNPIRLYRNQTLRNCHLGVHNAAGRGTDVDVVGQYNEFDVQDRALSHTSNRHTCALLKSTV